MNVFLCKTDRLFAWILFLGMILYFISGYGLTKGIINPEFAKAIHLDILTYIILAAFVGHSSYAIHLAFVRWHIWNKFSAVFLIIFYLVLIGGILYIDQYYIKDKNTDTKASGQDNLLNSEITNQKTFTLTELVKYNGQNGNKVYVAVDGDVYDLTAVFQGGKHFSHYAGTELTNAFYSYHAKQVLSKYPIVGKLIK